MKEAHKAYIERKERIEAARQLKKELEKQLQEELAQGRAALQENERNKQALEMLETTEKERVEEKKRAEKAEKELAELKSSQSLSTNRAQDLDRALKLCMEDKTKAEGHCHDHLSGLNPQQSYDEI